MRGRIPDALRGVLWHPTFFLALVGGVNASKMTGLGRRIIYWRIQPATERQHVGSGGQGNGFHNELSQG